jgi:di/tricarboxylate transporter
VHRGGTRLQGRVGDIVLQPGDTLLLQTGPHFARAHRNDPDFVLVSRVEEARALRRDRAPRALALLCLLLALMISGRVPVLMAAFLVAGLMVLTGCISTASAREGIDWQTLIGIAAAFGLGRALEKSGAAEVVARGVIAAAGPLGRVGVLGAVYLLMMIFCEIIPRNAAAALMFPFAMATARHLGASPRPFAMTILFAASLAFATPTGYQTHLMVHGPGRYRFSDFLRVGAPLDVILWLLATFLIPRVWPF